MVDAHHSTTTIPASVAGRVPPHDLDSEAAVLSALLLSREAFLAVAPILRAEHFYSDANGRIFEAVCELTAAGTPGDIVTVASWLRDRERLTQVGGASYLAQLADATPAVAHVTAHAANVVEKWRLRALIAAHQVAAAEGYGNIGTDVDTWAEAHLLKLRNLADEAPTRPSLTSPAAAVADLVSSWERPAPYAPTGLPGLDKLLSGGLRAGNVIGLAGAAKSGKSALAGQILYDATGPNVIGIYASVEMPRREVWARFIAREVFRLALADGNGRGPTGPLANFGEVFHGGAYRAGRVSGASEAQVALLARLSEATNRASSHANLYVEHIAPGSTPMHLRGLVRRARETWALAHPRAEKPLALLVIDPVQRLFAAPSGALTGTALDRANAERGRPHGPGRTAAQGDGGRRRDRHPVPLRWDEDGRRYRLEPSDGSPRELSAQPPSNNDSRSSLPQTLRPPRSTQCRRRARRARRREGLGSPTPKRSSGQCHPGGKHGSAPMTPAASDPAPSRLTARVTGKETPSISCLPSYVERVLSWRMITRQSRKRPHPGPK